MKWPKNGLDILAFENKTCSYIVVYHIFYFKENQYTLFCFTKAYKLQTSPHWKILHCLAYAKISHHLFTAAKDSGKLHFFFRLISM